MLSGCLLSSVTHLLLFFFKKKFNVVLVLCFSCVCVSFIVSKDSSLQPITLQPTFCNVHGNQHDLMAGKFYKTGASHGRKFFKDEEPEAVWDDYGLVIDMSPYRLDVAADAIGPIEPMDEHEDSAAILHTLSQLDKPTKVITLHADIQVQCQFHRVDFEGRTDGESMKRIMEHVKPRNLVLVHGAPDTTKSFASFCRESLGIENIIMPHYGQPVEITSGRNIFQVKLREALVSALELHEAGDYRVAWVDGIMTKGVMANAADHAIVDMDAGMPELGIDEEPDTHDVVFVGDLRLSDFKRILIEAGYDAQFSRGMLVINDTVAIVKSSGGLSIEGPFCPDYLAVRDLLYSQFAIA
eukprot:m.189803 g.189803  ORF g.189803 m.189803 type:complete len:354 (-) comp16747_c0_seq23:1438-2499(-)